MEPKRKKGKYDFPKAKRGIDRMEFTVHQSSKKRLDVFLTECFTGFSRSFMKRHVEQGKILVGGRRVKVSYTVNRGDHVTVLLDEPSGRQPEDIPLDVLHEDDDIIVLCKAAGMVVHPARGHLSGTVYNGLLFRYQKQMEADPTGFLLGSVHRLDEDTSGVMVYPRTKEAAQSLTRQFQDRLVSKEYLCVVDGYADFKEHTVDEPLGEDPADNHLVAVNGLEPKQACTKYRLLAMSAPDAPLAASALLAMPRTGRGHQIRVHAKHIGHVILGDWRYGGPVKTESGEALIARQALHARKLGFSHPRTGEAVSFSAPAPDDMQRLLDKLGISL